MAQVKLSSLPMTSVISTSFVFSTCRWKALLQSRRPKCPCLPSWRRWVWSLWYEWYNETSTLTHSILSTHVPQPKQPSPKGAKVEDYEDSGEEDEDDENADESYENLEGAYNPKDYSNLNATADVKDLFQYIERYKPQEVHWSRQRLFLHLELPNCFSFFCFCLKQVELDTVLKCFIPEYIPAIGEIDSFVKIPRPNDQLDDLGLKFLDEPAAMQVS